MKLKLILNCCNYIVLIVQLSAKISQVEGWRSGNLSSPLHPSPAMRPLYSDQIQWMMSDSQPQDYSYSFAFPPAAATRGRLNLLQEDMHRVGATIPRLQAKSSKLNFTWPIKRVAQVDGDIILGGLMMIHEREDSQICGPVMPQGGIQALECMLYTIDWVNDHDFVPGIKLGAYVLDDCDKDTYGLGHSLFYHFLKFRNDLWLLFLNR